MMAGTKKVVMKAFVPMMMNSRPASSITLPVEISFGSVIFVPQKLARMSEKIRGQNTLVPRK